MPSASRKPLRSQASRSASVGNDSFGSPSSSLKADAGGGGATGGMGGAAWAGGGKGAAGRIGSASAARGTAMAASAIAANRRAGWVIDIDGRGLKRLGRSVHGAGPPGGRAGGEIPVGDRAVDVLAAAAQRVVRQSDAAVLRAPRDDELDQGRLVLGVE